MKGKDMSHFYAIIRGNRGEATRMGGKSSGLYVNAAGWGGCVNTQLWHDKGKDYYRVSLIPWHGCRGSSRVIAEGPLDASAPEFITRGAAMVKIRRGK